jgi:hypothetical protein
MSGAQCVPAGVATKTKAWLQSEAGFTNYNSYDSVIGGYSPDVDPMIDVVCPIVLSDPLPSLASTFVVIAWVTDGSTSNPFECHVTTMSRFSWATVPTSSRYTCTASGGCTTDSSSGRGFLGVSSLVLNGKLDNLVLSANLRCSIPEGSTIMSYSVLYP